MIDSYTSVEHTRTETASPLFKPRQGASIDTLVNTRQDSVNADRAPKLLKLFADETAEFLGSKPMSQNKSCERVSTPERRNNTVIVN